MSFVGTIGTGLTWSGSIYVNPLINWVWAGGFVFILGTLIAAWPDASELRRRVTQPLSVRNRPVPQAKAATGAGSD